MAVRVRQQPYIQQPAVSPQPPQQPSKKPNYKKSKAFISKREKFLYMLFLVVVAIMAVAILHTQSKIQTTSMEIQQIEKEISEIANQNVGLKVQVSELSAYERILKRAQELGLTLNEKNVKVVPGE
ncbi:MULTISPECIES: cell division protein FtsL [Bacillales]|uniref:Cell division protein FtsL n=1 Tax=Lysinibacillus louembei TaxID=1470088 RepID=A0ABZ0RYF2_9BACI|nr:MULTISPECIES: cell division protein FtsL [Bacillales]MCT6924010.1 cell division protein FtsL [Metasolibacillus sp.]MCT6940132.1 cell division protein FtsL [Metasolibacillus sp.]WPK12049.1 cell division protein FtsL [Lysinibacillus louembei]